MVPQPPLSVDCRLLFATPSPAYSTSRSVAVHLLTYPGMFRLAGGTVTPSYPHPPSPSYAYVQATLGVGSVNFCTTDIGGAFFNLSHCVPCVLPHTLVLRCMMFIYSVKDALLAKRAFVGCFAPWFSE